MKRGKVIQFDWDFIGAKDDTEDISICLTWAERQILLTTLDYVGWLTRWYSPTEQTIDQDQIDEWRDSIAGKLMFGVCPVDCNDVIACIIAALDGTGTSLPDSLLEWLAEHQNDVQPYPNDGNGSIEIASEDLNIEGCDNDIIFGFTLQLTQAFHRWVTDFLEIVESITNSVELADAVLDSVPTLTSVLSLVDYFVETVAEAYAANYDDELESQIACDLFCIAIENEDCSLTFDDILQYLSDKLFYELSDITLSDWATFVSAGFWDGDEFVYIMFLTLAQVLAIGGDWTGITLAYIQRVISSFFNDPNSDWATLCTQCYWTYDIDFTTEQGGWYLADIFLSEEQGAYVSGVGWQPTTQNNGIGGDDTTKAVAIGFDLSSQNTHFNYIVVTYDFSNSGNWDGTGDTNIIALRLGGHPINNVEEVSAVSHPTGTDYGMSFTGDVVPDGRTQLCIQFVAGRLFADTNPGGNVTIKSISAFGVGDNPFD